MEKPTFEMDKICRLCLQNLEVGSQVNLFAVNFSIRPSDMIVRCASVQVYEKDGLPAAICNDCFYKLGMAFEFRNRCEASDQKLRMFVQNADGHKLDSQPDVVREDDIYAAMSAIFDQEGATEPKETSYDNSKAEEGTTENNSLETGSNARNVKKVQPIKKRAQLDELLKKHKAKLKEEGTKINIFKQKRASRKTGPGLAKKGTLLKEPEQCFTCGKSFNYSGYLQTHQRIHSGEKPFECQMCHRRFAQSGNLQLHLRIHNNERKYQCEICSKLFRTSSNLHAHRKTHSEERNFPCTLCERAFRTAQELRNHVDTHGTIKNFICRLCDDKSFHKQSYLNSHIKTVHIGVKRHRCQDCGKIFSNSSNLIAHRRVHSGDRPYSCKECDAKFTQSPSLLRHIKAKHRPKPVVSEIAIDTFEPAIEVDENRSLDSAASSELSVATSLIENSSGYNVPYMSNYVVTHAQPTSAPQTQIPTTHHASTGMQLAPSTVNLYSSELFQYPANSAALPPHHYQQQHLDVGSYDMCYSMPTHSMLNPSVMNPQPTYIFDQ